MRVNSQKLQHGLRLLMGAAAVYALLLQITLAALAGAPAGLDIASTLCVTDHNGVQQQQDQPGKALGHECICAGLCHAGFVAPPAQALRSARLALSLAYDQRQDELVTPRNTRGFSARDPPLSV